VPATTSYDQLEFSSQSRSKKLYEEMSRGLRRTKNCNEMENFDKNTKEHVFSKFLKILKLFQNHRYTRNRSEKENIKIKINKDMNSTDESSKREQKYKNVC
jgi:hypothetical protein